MIISQDLVAKKYATAYLNLYEATLTLDDISHMCAAATFLKKHSNFMLLICAVGVEKKEVIAVIEKLCEYFSFPQSLHKLIRVMMKHKKLSYLLEILQDICTLYKRRNNMLELEIKTAQKLGDEEIKKLEAFFEQQAQMRLKTTVQIDQSLIAGVRLQSNIFLWECSIAQKLKMLRQKFFVKG